LKASAYRQLYLALLPFTHAGSESINADSLKLQLLTALKKEWWPATADSLPVNCETHCFSGDQTHNQIGNQITDQPDHNNSFQIVSLTPYQSCYRDHQLT